jgi:hypothetical protein
MLFGRVVTNATYWTGIGLLNPGATDATATMELSGSNGMLIRSKEEVIKAGTRKCQLLQQYFEGLANQQGYMKVTSDQPLASFLKRTALESRAHRKTYWPSSPAPFKNSGVRKKLPQNAEFLLETSILNGCPSSKQFVRH